MVIGASEVRERISGVAALLRGGSTVAPDPPPPLGDASTSESSSEEEAEEDLPETPLDGGPASESEEEEPLFETPSRSPSPSTPPLGQLDHDSSEDDGGGYHGGGEGSIDYKLSLLKDQSQLYRGAAMDLE